MAGDALDDLGNLQVALVVDRVDLDPGALLALLVRDLPNIGVQLINRQARAGFNVATVLNFDLPLVASGKLQVLQPFLPVIAVGLANQLKELDRVLNARIARLVLIVAHLCLNCPSSRQRKQWAWAYAPSQVPES